MKLQVGDHLYTDGGRTRITITRVTEKRAYAQINPQWENTFDREVDESRFITRKGDHPKWYKTYYSVETPDLIEKFNHYRALDKVLKIDFKSLSLGQLQAILDITDH